MGFRVASIQDRHEPGSRDEPGTVQVLVATEAAGESIICGIDAMLLTTPR